MAATLKYLQKEVPMKSDIREQFMRRLTKIRNLVVADVALTNGLEIENVQKTIAKAGEQAEKEEAKAKERERLDQENQNES